MLLTLWDQFQTRLWHGNEPADMSIGQTVLRTILVYAITLALVRLGSKRFMAKATAFDVVAGIMLGSIMSRGVQGSSSLVLTVIAGMVLLGMHNFFAFLAYRTDWFGPLVKGSHVLLIEDGKLHRRGMQEANITEQDLTEAMRRETNHADPSRFRRAYLERNGMISFIPYKHEKREPRVCVVSVEKGVQTVRIEID